MSSRPLEPTPSPLDLRCPTALLCLDPLPHARRSCEPSLDPLPQIPPSPPPARILSPCRHLVQLVRPLIASTLILLLSKRCLSMTLLLSLDPRQLSIVVHRILPRPLFIPMEKSEPSRGVEQRRQNPLYVYMDPAPLVSRTRPS